MRFDNRVVVLTGVGREGQVGEAVARGFAERGAMVVLVDRQPTEVSQRAAALKAAGFRAWGFTADLTDPQQVEEVARRTAAAHGGQVDYLVNAAGGFAGSGRVAESDMAVFQRQLAVNLTTAYLATRAFLPLVRAAKGAVLYFASEAALPDGRAAGISAYAAAKAGVLALMRAVAQEERDAGVRANALAPGAIRTAANVQGGDAGPFVEREDVVQAVLYLCSPKARAVTGQVLRLEARMDGRPEARR
jgi:NAD(P)-dependent dehydrogenase (short-subunit alcohol dehydrogenase family)